MDISPLPTPRKELFFVSITDFVYQQTFGRGRFLVNNPLSDYLNQLRMYDYSVESWSIFKCVPSHIERRRHLVTFLLGNHCSISCPFYRAFTRIYYNRIPHTQTHLIFLVFASLYRISTLFAHCVIGTSIVDLEGSLLILL